MKIATFFLVVIFVTFQCHVISLCYLYLQQICWQKCQTIKKFITCKKLAPCGCRVVDSFSFSIHFDLTWQTEQCNRSISDLNYRTRNLYQLFDQSAMNTLSLAVSTFSFVRNKTTTFEKQNSATMKTSVVPSPQF